MTVGTLHPRDALFNFTNSSAPVAAATSPPSSFGLLVISTSTEILDDEFARDVQIGVGQVQAGTLLSFEDVFGEPQ